MVARKAEVDEASSHALNFSIVLLVVPGPQNSILLNFQCHDLENNLFVVIDIKIFFSRYNLFVHLSAPLIVLCLLCTLWSDFV